MATRATTRLAFACAISAVGGLLIPLAAFASLYHAIALWIALSLAAGLILGGIRNQQPPSVARRAATASLFVPGAAIGFYWVRWLATWIKNPEDRNVLLPLFSGYVGPVDTWVLAGLAAIAATSFVASFVLVGLVALAAEPMTESLRKAFNFGPEGFDRVNKILVAVTAVIASLVGLLSALGLSSLPG